jgi:hypothetical protein
MHPDVFLRNIISVAKRPLSVTAFALLAVGSIGPHAVADEIYFTSGYSETGVVVRETETAVKFKTEMGMVTVSREKVSFIEKASDKENQEMLKKWREKALLEEEQMEAKREAQKRYEIEQLKKGFVKFEDEWMTPERRQEVLQKRKEARADKMQFESRQIEKGLVKFQHIWVTPAVEKQLLEMKEQIDQLVEEIEENREEVAAYRNAMLNVNSFNEAEEFGQKVKELDKKISESEKELDMLFKRADDIEAASVRYVTPEEFIEFLPPEEVLR